MHIQPCRAWSVETWGIWPPRGANQHINFTGSNQPHASRLLECTGLESVGSAMSVTPTTNLLINKFTQSGAIALTTVFTPPAPCLDPTLYPTAPSWAIFSSSCAPYPNSAWFNYQRAASSWYSPGVCPHSYEYVATSIQQLEGGGRITLAVCCPAYVPIGDFQPVSWYL